MSKTRIDELRVPGATTGQILVCVNDRGDFVPGSPSGDVLDLILVDRATGEILVDRGTGNVLAERP